MAVTPERQAELLQSGDYVIDPVHGLVPKDVETANRIRREQRLANAEATKTDQAPVPPAPKPVAPPADTKTV